MNGPKEPTFEHSLVSFGGIIVIVSTGLLWLGISLHSLLLVALICTGEQAMLLGFYFQEIKSALIEVGTIGGLVYFGVDFLHPTIFLPAGLVLCSLMSIVLVYMGFGIFRKYS